MPVFVVKKHITYYAQIEAATLEEALEIAKEQGHIDSDADAVEDGWEAA